MILLLYLGSATGVYPCPFLTAQKYYLPVICVENRRLLFDAYISFPYGVTARREVSL